jgi:hypothetical protein
MAGCLKRWHSWSHVREQTVADHSWHVMRILLAVWPEAPRELLVHCLVHDVGEIGTGDMPYPVKKDNPVLKREADRIEGDTHLSMCIPWGLPSAQPMPALWKDVFKLAEFVEMWEDAQHELMMGNRFCQPVADRCWSEIDERAEALAAHEPEIAGRASWYCARRRREWGLSETTVSRFGRVE